MLDGKNISKLLNIVMLFIYDHVFFLTDNNTFLYKISKEFFLIMYGERLAIITFFVNVLINKM